nr:unnamed protein product [Callosobruchus analis]
MLSDDSSEKYLITLKKVCPTRWSSRNDALLAVKKNFLLIMKTLYQLNLISNKKMSVKNCSLHFFLHYFKLLILFLQLYSMNIMTCRNLLISDPMENEDKGPISTVLVSKGTPSIDINSQKPVIQLRKVAYTNILQAKQMINLSNKKLGSFNVGGNALRGLKSIVI